MVAEDGKKDKIKLKIVYQPVETGPRLELGTIGTQDGAMGRSVLNVAFDWKF